MRYEVYLDSYFWLSLVLNGFILYLTGRLYGLRIIRKRLFAGACTAAFLSCAGIFLPVPAVIHLSFWQIGCDALTLEAAYGIRDRKRFCQTLFFHYMAGSILSGMVIWAGRVLELVWGRPVSPILLVLAAGAGSVLAGSLAVRLRDRKRKRLFSVVLQEQDRKVSTTALLDTGNSLREPFSGRPVCIIEQDLLNRLADEDYRMQNPQKTRIIPYHSIGRPHGLMKGFCISRMWIDTEAGQICLSDVIAAESENEITGCGRYQMILHPLMIGEEEEST